MAYPRSGSSSAVSGPNWNLEILIFVEGGKPENPVKNPRSRDENRQQTQPTYGVELCNLREHPVFAALVSLACVSDVIQLPVRNVCEAAPKSLFWTPNCVPGFEYAP